MSEEPTPQKRRVAPEVAAIRAERKLMLPFRRRIGELQSQVAFIAARAISGKHPDRQTIDAEYSAMRYQVEQVMGQVDEAVGGPGLGPAEDCRRALRMLEQRLPR